MKRREFITLIGGKDAVVRRLDPAQSVERTSAFGTRRTSSSALHMSAFDPDFPFWKIEAEFMGAHPKI